MSGRRCRVSHAGKFKRIASVLDSFREEGAVETEHHGLRWALIKSQDDPAPGAIMVLREHRESGRWEAMCLVCCGECAAQVVKLNRDRPEGDEILLCGEVGEADPEAVVIR